MNKKRFTHFVTLCTKNNTLDVDKVFLIANHLSRSNLKNFIRALKKWQNETTLTVFVARSVDKTVETQMQNLFPTKKILYKLDPTIMAGTRIVNNDTVYEMNLKHELDTIAKHVQQ